MPRYRVKAGHVLPQDGVAHPAGAEVALSPLQAGEPDIAGRVELIPDTVSTPPDTAPLKPARSRPTPQSSASEPPAARREE